MAEPKRHLYFSHIFLQLLIMSELCRPRPSQAILQFSTCGELAVEQETRKAVMTKRMNFIEFIFRGVWEISRLSFSGAIKV